jgi:hypothetical protein
MIPPKEEFVEKHRDELYGMVCKALTQTDEAIPLAKRMRMTDERIATLLRLMYDELIPPNQPVVPKPPPVATPPKGSPTSGPRSSPTGAR